MTRKTLIFTDLDGTLLDHYTYQTAPAEKIMTTLKSLSIPIIPNSSKTFSEISLIRKQLTLSSPFIIENGAAVYIPVNYFPTQPAGTHLEAGYWVKTFCQDKAHWLTLLEQSSEKFAGLYQGFSTMTVEELATVTGLSVDNANMAKQRQYGEPIYWLGDQIVKTKFIEQMTQLGAHVLEGGRFLHISGDCDKGRAQAWLAEQYTLAEETITDIESIALGDGKNDIDMLEQATIAVQIRSPVHDFPKLNRTNNIYQSNECGPTGWAESINHILSVKLIG